ncbi:hypothetical protein [Marinobacter nauticus]|uniref:Asparagine synthetase domain-containing protein n=1 Tax=Marinobacter nauticus TaxID=2743 RepID=A0A368URT3_MARNT|nr:hypothetical protein [Marinobacter nauticus]RBP69261.1 hypothetical protein DET64_11426 [Marinobacter nauticus]RCW30740.1 hypothetical protein DET51_11426 [Marinobacter nauticus]
MKFSINFPRCTISGLPTSCKKFFHNNEEIYFIGSVNFLYEYDGYTPVDYSDEKLKSILFKEKEKSPLYIEGTFIIIINDFKSVIVANDFFGRFRLFYTRDKDTVYFDTDIQELIEISPEKSELHSRVFDLKGYMPRGYTQYSKIYKTFGGEAALFKPGEDKLLPLFEPGTVGVGKGTYKEFKDIVDKTFPFYFCKNRPNVIEFSGGLDSFLLVLFAKKHRYPVSLVTGRLLNPSLDQNKFDVINSLKKAFQVNVPLKLVDIDLQLGEDYFCDGKLALLRRNMPCERHSGVLQLKVASEISESFKDPIAVNGQNADSIICLGPSEKLNFSLSFRGILSGIKGFISRLFLLDRYCRFVDTNKETSLTKLKEYLSGKRLIGIPKNRIEFLLGINLFSNGYLPIITKKSDIDESFLTHLIGCYYQPYENFSVSDSLYLSKLQFFLNSGDHRVVLATHELYSLDVVLPYSSIAMFRFFANCKRGFQFAINGKKYLQRYVREENDLIEKVVSPKNFPIR